MEVVGMQRTQAWALSLPTIRLLPDRRETSSQTHYFGKFLFRGSRLPLLDCKLPQGGNHGYHFLASLRKPSWALELSRCADWGSE